MVLGGGLYEAANGKDLLSSAEEDGLSAACSVWCFLWRGVLPTHSEAEYSHNNMHAKTKPLGLDFLGIIYNRRETIAWRTAQSSLMVWEFAGCFDNSELPHAYS